MNTGTVAKREFCSSPLYLEQHAWVGDRFSSSGRIRFVQFPVVQFLKLGAGHADGCILRQ